MIGSLSAAIGSRNVTRAISHNWTGNRETQIIPGVPRALQLHAAMQFSTCVLCVQLASVRVHSTHVCARERYTCARLCSCPYTVFMYVRLRYRSICRFANRIQLLLEEYTEKSVLRRMQRTAAILHDRRG